MHFSTYVFNLYAEHIIQKGDLDSDEEAEF